MDKVILYFGYLMFFLFVLYIIFIIMLYLFIFLSESLQKIKLKSKKNVNTIANKSNEKKSNLKKLIINIYEGLYRLCVFKTANLPSNNFRLFIYKHIFKMNIGKNVVIHKGLEIRGGV